MTINKSYLTGINHMKFQIKIKSVYGVERIYPANETAERMTKLIGRKTFSNQDLIIIASLGFIIEQVNAFEMPKLEIAK